jgi:hypothetical protein
MAHPEEAHWQAVTHILRYLKGSLDYGILYSRAESSNVKGFTAASAPIRFEGTLMQTGQPARTLEGQLEVTSSQLPKELLYGQVKDSRLFLCHLQKQNIAL